MTRGSESEKAVSRTLRETLNALQRTAEELNQALNDLVAACGSSRPSNSLPPILRAQSAAASLAASFEVLSRFVANSLQSVRESDISEPEPPSAAPPSRRPVAVVPAPSPQAEIPVEQSPAAQSSAPVVLPDMGEDLAPVQEPAVKDFATSPVGAPLHSPPAEAVEQPRASDVEGERADYFAEISVKSAGHPPPNPIEELPSSTASFDVSALLPEEQDLHRRANRVAKVSMQDIKMLRPNEVLLGREHRDICVRLRDDIEKAHKEYGRRFQSILGHPVDYFYDWMVQILGDGDPQALGEYPYRSPALRR
jgi:hypothetical protein